MACTRQSDERLEHDLPGSCDPGSLRLPSYFMAEDGSLVISFDSGWYPFLCNTRGYNTGPQRWYIPKVSRLIARVAHVVQTPSQKRLTTYREDGSSWTPPASDAGLRDIER